jgi:hypothetical protein
MESYGVLPSQTQPRFQEVDHKRVPQFLPEKKKEIQKCLIIVFFKHNDY